MTFNPGDEVKIINMGNPYEPIYAEIVRDDGDTVRVKRPEPCCPNEIIVIGVPKAIVRPRENEMDYRDHKIELGLQEPGRTCDDCRWKVELNECPWNFDYDKDHPWAEDCCDFRNVRFPEDAFE